MKKLIIIRHAKSSWDNPTLKDYERPLNKRGLRDAPFMAEVLKSHGISPDLMITSPAVRALSTAQIFAQKFDYDANEIIQEKSLYLGDIEEIIHSTFLIGEHMNEVLIFGHNPGITYFANVVCEANIENVPTSGALIIESNSPTWEDTDISKLELKHFLYPKMSLEL